MGIQTDSDLTGAVLLPVRLCSV